MILTKRETLSDKEIKELSLEDAKAYFARVELDEKNKQRSFGSADFQKRKKAEKRAKAQRKSQRNK